VKKFILFLLLLLSFGPVLVSAKSFYFDHVQLDYAVHDDGSVSVSETLGFVFDGSFSYAYRYWDLAKGEEISGLRVFELKNGVLNLTNVEVRG